MWRACERLNIRPEGIKPSWDDNNFWVQCQMTAYSQIREYEDAETMAAYAKI